MLSEQSPEQLRDIVDIIAEKQHNKTVNTFALQDAIEAKNGTDPDFASQTSPLFIGTKLAVKVAASAAPFILPKLLGSLGEHKITEIMCDVVSYVCGNSIEKKLDQYRKSELELPSAALVDARKPSAA